MFGLFKRSARKSATELPPPVVMVPIWLPCARDWAAGDLAKCVTDGRSWTIYPTGEEVAGPKRGQILRVSDVRAENGTIWLTFACWPDHSFVAGLFRKLRACTAEFHAQVLWPVPIPPIRTPELVP